MRVFEFELGRHTTQLATFMAMLMIVSPVAILHAQTPSGEQATAGERQAFATKYITPETAVVAYLQPQQILTSPKTEMLPRELASTGGLELLGIDTAKVSRVVVVVEPPVAGPPQVAVVLSLAEKFDIGKLPPQVRRHTVEDEVGGRKYFKSQSPAAPSFFMPDDTTLFIAHQAMLQKHFAKDKQAAEGPLVERVKARSGTEDFYMVADVQALMPLIQMSLRDVAAQAPPQAQEFLKAPEHVELAELAIHFTTPGKSQLQVHALDAQSADKLEDLVGRGLDKVEQQLKFQGQQMATSGDPYQAAMGRYFARVAEKMVDPYRPRREGERFVLVEVDFDKLGSQATTLTWVGALVAGGLPTVHMAGAPARQRLEGTNNMKHLMLSMLNYESAYKRLPAHASYDDDDKPLLSWRVHMLPYLEQQALYDQFRLDEPWDSEHNKALISQMPDVFLSPRSSHTADQGLTNYLVPIGEDFIYEETSEGTPLRRITDGTSFTIALLEVDDEHAVPWTAPEDWEYDAEQPTRGLFGLAAGNGLVGFCDGSVSAITDTIDVETFYGLLTKAGGEVVERP